VALDEEFSSEEDFQDIYDYGKKVRRDFKCSGAAMGQYCCINF
jgi:hypothetical protein